MNTNRLAGLAFITSGILFGLLYTKNIVSKKVKEILSLYTFPEITNTFILSIIRYLVFAFQYYLILKLFGIESSILTTFTLIALTFFVSTVIPTFALTEIAVRSAAAIYFFSTISNDTTAIVSASLALWIINIAIPALIGNSYVWKLNFFRA